jgi:hypothetical protein
MIAVWLLLRSRKQKRSAGSAVTPTAPDLQEQRDELATGTLFIGG